MCVTSIDADHGKIDASKLVPKPARHRAGLETDTLGIGRAFAKEFGQSTRIGLGLSFVDLSARHC